MKNESTLGKNRYQAPLSDQAYLLLREQILRGVFPPSAVLSRRKLAVEFGMSLLPISEALQRLESDGLVESRPRVGTRVRTPTLEEVQGRYVVREALEAQAARLCCEVATFRNALNFARLLLTWIRCSLKRPWAKKTPIFCSSSTRTT